jgi:hypothetical protein
MDVVRHDQRSEGKWVGDFDSVLEIQMMSFQGSEKKHAC